MAAFPTPHTAQVLAYEAGVDPAWIEGEPGTGPEPVLVATIPCLLFVPLGQEDQQPRSRKITRPTVMWDPADIVPVGAVSPRADDELLIDAGELAPATGATQVRWQIEGQPQPFGPPGEALVGLQATLKRVEG